MFFLSVNMVAQFAAGARIMKIILPSEAAQAIFREDLSGTGGPSYLLGLLIFTLTVVAYTAYGGFLAGDLRTERSPEHRDGGRRLPAVPARHGGGRAAFERHRTLGMAQTDSGSNT